LQSGKNTDKQVSQVSRSHCISTNLLLLFGNMVENIVIKTQDFDIVGIVELQLLQQVAQTAYLIVRHVQIA
jgi:hypothetical protein